MNRANYDEPLVITYSILAGVVSSAGDLITFVGPAGMRGRVIDMTNVVVTGVTTAASDLLVGTQADPNQYASQVVAIAATDAVTNAFTNFSSDTVFIAADSLVVVSTGGAAAAGSVNAAIVIGWF